ncbi:MAG: LPS export ABC transporter periplasmic protein LptC [Alphaproteobacteria bacterium]
MIACGPVSADMSQRIARQSLHTRIVVASRRFLWVLVALMVAAIIWVTVGDNKSDGARLVFSGSTPDVQNEQNVMMAPRYQGLDEKNQPYVVEADKAVQLDKETVLLYNIKSDISQQDGAWLALDAAEGKMQLDREYLFLHRGVHLFYEGGYEMSTEQAHIDIDKGTAYGESLVQGIAPMGTLQADSFSARDQGKVIEFNGSVRMTIYP